MATAKTKTANKRSAAKAVAAVPQAKSRLNFRLAPEIKERVARAASISGQDLTEFAIATLAEKADAVIERHDHILLGSDDHKFFIETLNGRSKPSERSRTSADKYKRGVRKGVRYQLVDRTA